MKNKIIEVLSAVHEALEHFINFLFGEVNENLEKGTVNDMCDRFYPVEDVDQLLLDIETLNTAISSVLNKKLTYTEVCVNPNELIEVPVEATNDDIIEIFLNYRNIKFAKDAVYKISKSIYVYSDTIVDLNGATLQRYGAIDVLDAFIDPDNTTGYNGVQNVVIKNGTIEGMNSLGLRSTNLTTWMHCNNLRFENVTFLDSPGGHCCDMVGCSNVLFLNCKFLGYCTAGNDYAESIQIDYAAHKSLPSYPVGSACYDMTYCKNIVIDGCVFDKSDNYPAQYCAIGAHSQGDDYNYHQDIIVRNCIATGNGVCEGSVQYGAFVRCMKFKNTLIENNTIDNYGRMVWVTMPGSLYCADGTTVSAASHTDKVLNVENLVVIANKILSNKVGWKSYGVYMKDTFKKSKNIMIQDLNVPSTAVYIVGCDNTLTSL